MNAVLCTIFCLQVVAIDQCSNHQFDASFLVGTGSCKEIYNNNEDSHNRSGYYWIVDSNDQLQQVYCDMKHTGGSCREIYQKYPDTHNKSGYYRTTMHNLSSIHCAMDLVSAACGTFTEWTEVAKIDVSTGSECPSGWNRSSRNNKTFCSANNTKCHSVHFTTTQSYKSICGKIRGYQKGKPNGFRRITKVIDKAYVDGVSITHGNPRQHIWTYAVSHDSGTDSGMSKCHCGGDPPPYVGSYYYCDVTKDGSDDYQLSKPLWSNCSEPLCCNYSAMLAGWFYRQLNTTSDDIEVRMCTDQRFDNEALLLDQVELYIQ